MKFVVVGEGFPPVKVLETVLAESRGEVVAVFTDIEQPGRLGTVASQAGIPLMDARVLGREEGAEALSRLEPDWLINANSTVIIRGDVLDVPASGCLNLHPGLLPEYAGLHTHQWAIRNGEIEFGSTIHFMDPSVDAGDIAGIVRFPIRSTDTGLSLFHRCINEGVNLLRQILQTILDGGTVPRETQDLSRRRLYRHRDALDGRIDWTASARAVVDFVRAANYEPFTSPTYTPHLDAVPGDEAPVLVVCSPGPSTDRPPGSIVGRVDDGPVVACGDGSVTIERAKWRGRVMTAADWTAYLAALGTGLLAGRRG